ncbi:MAG TPA: hypothetical protein VNU71_23165, partial [Burkholderiaceae bacterium]|nr:hypothetical protein [Burkholderiaceae bacterium]
MRQNAGIETNSAAMDSPAPHPAHSPPRATLPRAAWVGGGVLCLAVAALAGALVMKSVGSTTPAAANGAPPLALASNNTPPAAAPRSGTPVPPMTRQDEVPPPPTSAAAVPAPTPAPAMAA